MDEEVLDMEIIRSLRQQAPTGEDITALKEFDGDHTKLGKVGGKRGSFFPLFTVEQG